MTASLMESKAHAITTRQATRPARVLEIGPFPPPYNGWSLRIAVVREGLTNAGHHCVPLNLGENRHVPSSEYECVRSGGEYLRKLIRYAWRGYTFHVHTNGDSLKGFVVNGIAYAVSLLTFKRPVLSFHAGVDQIYFPKQQSFWLRPVLWFLFAAARGIICDAPLVAAKIIEYGISPKKVFPISPFTRQYLAMPGQPLSAEAEAFLAAPGPLLLTYLEIRPEYALEQLFAGVALVVRQVPNARLLVVGASRERKEVAELAERHGLRERILHLGAIERGEFLSLLKRVRLYLRSARTEGISASIREAICLGLPVVANATDSQPAEIVSYRFADSDDLARAVMSVLQQDRAADRTVDASSIPDTVPDEIAVLIGEGRSSS